MGPAAVAPRCWRGPIPHPPSMATGPLSVHLTLCKRQESFSARSCSFPKEYRSKIFQRKGKLEPCHASDDSDAARQRNSCRISGSRPNLGRASTRSRRVKHGYDKMSQTHQVLSNSEANINKPEMGHVIHFINLLPSRAGAVGGN